MPPPNPNQAPSQRSAPTAATLPPQQQVTVVHHVPSSGKPGVPREYLQTRVDTYSLASGAHGDTTGPYKLGEEWLTGTGPRHHIFGAGDPMTEMLRKHWHVRQLVGTVCRQLHAGIVPPAGRDPYQLSGLRGIPSYIQDYSNVWTGGHTGNLAVTYLGSYALTYQVANFDRAKGTAELQIHVVNTSTIESATHPPLIGYLPQWGKYIGQPLNRHFRTGPLSLTRQDFYWTEYLDLSKPACQ